MKSDMQIIIGGAAGEGSKKAGLLIAKLFNAYGYRVFIHEDYESVIKGGHNFSHISASRDEKNAISEKIDFLLALNKETVVRHSEKLLDGGVLLYDSNLTEEPEIDKERVGVPLNDIVSEAEGIALMKNTALVSAFSKVIGMDFEKVKEVLRRELPVETEKNLQVAGIAYQKTEKLKDTEETGSIPLPFLSGNEAVALGAVVAGLENYFAYPMTPSTGILQFLCKIEGVRTFQPESEIAVVNAALGSAYTGRRTMIGTSGGGFALMTEGISFSAQSETPLVVALSQRMGPATGVPTYEAQGDLLFALNAGHGDMVRFVVAPGDVDEAYYLSGKALNISWKYQLPSIILLDKELSENTYNFKKEYLVEKEEVVKAENNENYNRYEGEDVSPLLFPGEGGVVKTTGYEHNKKGIATENAEEIKKMHDKRLRKYEKLKEELKDFEVAKAYKEGSVAVVFWGSTKGTVIEATKGMNVKLIQLIVIQPFLEEKIKELFIGIEKVISVEMNATSQMAQVLKMHGINVDVKITKYDGRPFTIEELKKEIEKNL
jgi:2-oxoglutarate/2-oxoacid ferredoxin oxidoreductase subunit alpha